MNKKINSKLGMQNKPKAKGVKFTNTANEYTLNQETGKWEVTGTEDLQEAVNSARDNTIKEILEKLQNGDAVDLSGTPAAQVTKKFDKLADIAEATNRANDLKEKYNLDPNLTVEQTYQEMEKLIDANKVTIEELMKPAEEKPKEEKPEEEKPEGGNKDE